ncbi:hypothetical protein F5Y15DRAFT_203680 [Xylariaceae sp. FL0016]|nr:hypothetical protein F5Y15DRAFT_203680 [Xylariaceae sp. FL0016]
MLVRERSRTAVVICLAVLAIYLLSDLWTTRSGISYQAHQWLASVSSTDHKKQTAADGDLSIDQSLPTAPDTSEVDTAIAHNTGQTHTILYSQSTVDRKFFLIKFGDEKTINPSILPHPTLPGTWVIIAQRFDRTKESQSPHVELACDAAFIDDALQCTSSPITLPILATEGGKCEGDLGYVNLNVGPHDARVFLGPQGPYTVYGSNSKFTCFSQWIQNFDVLIGWASTSSHAVFHQGTELQRPLPYSMMEKNWFIFWDKDDQMFAHYDIAPKRVFARLGLDGSAGTNMADQTAQTDAECIEKYLPQLGPESEDFHQATNSLSVTMCKRSDPLCRPDDDNTIILTVFHRKTYHNFQGVYEPYVMAFRRRQPFEVYGFSRTPLWIHGREVVRERHQMFYITSINWRSQGLGYHGYLDDVLFLGFGIDDALTAGIDVLAGDLLTSLGRCDDI